MTFQRATFLAAAILCAATQDVSGFGVNPLVAQHRSLAQSTTLMAEPSASEKAAELRKKAEEAKKKAEELKKVAEKKAEAAMVAVKKANDSAAEKKAEPEPAAATKTPTPPKASSKVFPDAEDGAIIAINQETIEFTSGIIGGAVALAFGASPVLAVVAAAAANYVSKKDDLGEINEFMQGITKASLSTINWLGKLDAKYTLLGKLQENIDKSLNDLKSSESGSAETVKKIEGYSKQLKQLADDIDLLEGSKQALGAVGEVLETGIDKAIDANKEYKLTDRATEAAKKAVEKAKESSK